MNIGFFHNDNYPLVEGSSVQSWQLILNLQKKHQIFTDWSSPFPQVKRIYYDKRDFFKLANKIDIALIIIDGTFSFNTEKFSLLALLGVPVIWLINAPHTEMLALNNKDSLGYKIAIIQRIFFSKFVSGAVTISHEVGNYAANTLKISQVKILPNGTDFQHFKPGEMHRLTVLDQFKQKFKVVWAGNGSYPWQALDLIVKAAKKAYSIDKNILFVIITKDSWYPLPVLPNLLVLPSVSYKDLPLFLNAADVCLAVNNPQIQKVFYNSPMKLFDYMSMRKPIIASNIGQIKEIIKDGQNGLLINNSANDLLKKLLWIKNNKKKAQKIGAQARNDVIRYYNWNRMVEDLELYLERFIK